MRGEGSSMELTQHTQRQQIYMQTSGSSSRIYHCIMQHLGMTERCEFFYFMISLQCFSRGSFMPAQALSWNHPASSVCPRAFLFYFRFGFMLSRCPWHILSIKLKRSFMSNLSWHPCMLGVSQRDFNLFFNTPISQELKSSLLCHCLLTVAITR